jgi:hypothetical protein
MRRGSGASLAFVCINSCAILGTTHLVDDYCHQVGQGIVDELPYLARQLLVFYWQAYLGIT